MPDGRLLVADARFDDGDSATNDAALRATGLPARFSTDMERRCDAVADWLIERGYRVERLPFFACDDPKVFVTYNNVLFETRADGTPHVYLPTYDLPEWDGRASAIWESAGVTVHPIRVRRIFVHRGSVRCLSHVLRRSP